MINREGFKKWHPENMKEGRQYDLTVEQGEVLTKIKGIYRGIRIRGNILSLILQCTQKGYSGEYVLPVQTVLEVRTIK